MPPPATAGRRTHRQARRLPGLPAAATCSPGPIRTAQHRPGTATVSRVGLGGMSRAGLGGLGGLRTKACNILFSFIPCLCLLAQFHVSGCQKSKSSESSLGGGGRLASKGALLHGLPRPLLGPNHRNCVSCVRVLPRSHINKRSSFVAPNCCLDVIALMACLCDYVLTCLLVCLCHLSMPCCPSCALLCL